MIGEGPTKRLQQQAGPQSALGRFKFDFDNKYAVYLHDTPAQAKFASYDRLASHGCVRLEKPADLAELLLRGSIPTGASLRSRRRSTPARRSACSCRRR